LVAFDIFLQKFLTGKNLKQIGISNLEPRIQAMAVSTLCFASPELPLAWWSDCDK
jgi:hypothetical protein